jgi:hypothetical protein
MRIVMIYIAYVDNNKKIALARVLGNEGVKGAVNRVSQQVGHTPAYYPISATTPEEAKMILAQSFGEDRFFISAFNNPT